MPARAVVGGRDGPSSPLRRGRSDPRPPSSRGRGGSGRCQYSSIRGRYPGSAGGGRSVGRHREADDLGRGAAAGRRRDANLRCATVPSPDSARGAGRGRSSSSGAPQVRGRGRAGQTTTVRIVAASRVRVVEVPRGQRNAGEASAKPRQAKPVRVATPRPPSAPPISGGMALGGGTLVWLGDAPAGRRRNG